MSEMPHGLRLFWLAALAIFVLTAPPRAGALAPSEAGGEEIDSKAESASRKAQREENVKEMGQRAAGVTVRTAGGKPQTSRLIAKPLFHYTDEPRRIIDATLWGWMSGGRLQAVTKIEKYDHPEPERKWLYCFGSLSTGLIDVEWKEGRRWSSRKPGIELASISDAPEPAGNKAVRLRQMKDLAGRFQATILVNDQTSDMQIMRLLPRPLFRYEQPIDDLVDGAVFGLTTNGTNPDAILVVELHKSGDGPAEWQFGVAGMTAGGLTIKLDDKQVWSKPFVSNHGSYDTWLWFFGKPDQSSSPK